jgi:hypothetical protein
LEQKSGNKIYKTPGNKTTKIWEQKLQISRNKKLKKNPGTKLQKSGNNFFENPGTKVKKWEQKFQKSGNKNYKNWEQKSEN